MQKKQIALFILSLVLMIAMYFGVLQIWSTVGIDWKETFFPAARAVLHGESPYSVPTFRNAPWTILFLLPFALFSETTGGIFFFLASFGIYAWVAYRLQASRFALIVFLLSPPVVYGMRMLNIDIFVLIGFTLPAQVGLFFVLIKPQMGIAMIPFWLIQSYRQGGIRKVITTFIPVLFVAGLSFFMFGNWLTDRQSDLLDSLWNASLWPWAIPIGIVLTSLSIRDRRSDLAMAASPFLSPYLAYHSWVSVLAGLIRFDFEFVVTVIAMWFVAVLIALGIA